MTGRLKRQELFSHFTGEDTRNAKLPTCARTPRSGPLSAAIVSGQCGKPQKICAIACGICKKHFKGKWRKSPLLFAMTANRSKLVAR
jgi:hypothetical protein